MKLVKITTAYPQYLKNYYAEHTNIETKSYLEQKNALDFDGFGWADFWSHAMKPLGYEVFEITLNAMPMQKTWARENGMQDADSLSPEAIVLEQVKKIEPDILWYDYFDEKLLSRIRFEIPTVRLVLGWVGSAIPKTNVWQNIDVILSCAPESVDKLRRAGFNAQQLHHAFDPRINERLKNNPQIFDLTFIGQIVRGNQFHLERERILESLCSKANIQIFSPSAGITTKDIFKTFVKRQAFSVIQMLKKANVSKEIFKKIPKVYQIYNWAEKPNWPVNFRLKPYIKNPVFGLDMFQVLKDSKITLNIHADSSPEYASNMRLWEATGVGTCLITDWRKNLNELFIPDKEIVTYKSVDECVEKVKWLLEHPAECQEIAKAGQARTLKEHTFSQRAIELDEMIRKELKL
ncbi:MAG: glycosyltransferase [Deltaproteobacteria bacterium]